MSDWFTPVMERKARKPHRCDWCGEGIAVGDVHNYQSGRFWGEFQSNRWHIECWDSTDDCDLSDGFDLYEHERPRMH